MVCFWILHIYWNTLFSLPRPQSQISDFGTSKVSYWSRACPVKNNTTLSEQWASLVRIRLQSRRPGFDPWVGRSPGEGKGYQLQYSGLENSMDYTHGVAKSWTWLSNFRFHFHWNTDWIIQAIHTLPSEGAKEEKEDKEKKGATEVEMVGLHHWFNGHEFEQTPGDGEGQGSLAWYSPWDHKELDTT